MRTLPFPIAVLGLPEDRVPHIVARSRSILLSMAQSPWFPAPSPPLATVEAAVVVLEQAQAATLAGTVGTIPARDEKLEEVRALMKQLRDHVQVVADGNREHGAAIIESAGMSVKKKRGGRPRAGLEAEPGPVSGSVLLRAPKAGNRAAYEWASSVDGAATFASLSITVQATYTVHGLTRGTRAWFRYRTSTAQGMSDWCEPVSLIVL